MTELNYPEWQAFPKNKPTDEQEKTDFIVAIPNPTKSKKAFQSTAPDFWFRRALWLKTHFICLENDSGYINSVKFFYALPPLPPKN